MALILAVSVGSLTSPGTAYAKHGNGAAIALGILGGALAGAPLRRQPRQVLRSATDLLPSLYRGSSVCGIYGA
jgi:hypothetical protein